MENAQIHLYHGTGKGKTTAAVGLCIRAVGAGKKVLFAQFMKGNDSSELKVLRSLTQVKVLQVGHQYGFSWKMDQDSKEQITARHNEILTEIEKCLQQEQYDLLILDEVVSAYRLQFLDCSKVRELLEQEKGSVEIVMTGRDPDEYLRSQADYITNMQMERHPYEKGVAAREGIEW